MFLLTTLTLVKKIQLARATETERQRERETERERITTCDKLQLTATNNSRPIP